MTINFDFIVIGGGICGLEIGALCSKLGKVLLLEKSAQLGGRAIVKEINGFKLDFGPHPVRFGQKSAMAQTLREIGGRVEFINPGVMYAFLANGERHYFPSGNIKAILKTKMVSVLSVIKLFGKLLRMKKQEFDRLKAVNLDQFCERYQVDSSLRRFLLMASASMQVNPFPERTSMGEMFQNFSQVIKKKSVFYPKGGWNTFFSQFQAAIERNGEIRTNMPVNKIILKEGQAIGVQCGTETLYAPTIISTIPVQHLFEILDPLHCSEAFVTRCNTLRPTAGISIDFCLKTPVTSDTLCFFEDPLAFALCPTNMDPGLAPPGKSIVSVFGACNRSVLKSEAERNAFYNRLKSAACKAYPKLENNIEHERPLFLEMVDGVEIAADQHGTLRPGILDTGIQNLYLTGDSVGGEGAGGDVGHTSVRECYDLILKRIK